MMDGAALYPGGFHPSWKDRTLINPSEYAKHLRRSDLRSIKYYIIDFGISIFYKDPDAPKLAVGREGRDVDAPELSSDVPYDPFPVDVYTLGRVYRRSFIDKYDNVEFLEPLIQTMTAADPSHRPTSSEVLSQFLVVEKHLSRIQLRRRLRRDVESILERLFHESINALCNMRRSAKAGLRHFIQAPRRFISYRKIHRLKTC